MLRRILNSNNEAIVILNNYFKGGVGKSKLSTMFAYLTDKFNLKGNYSGHPLTENDIGVT